MGNRRLFVSNSGGESSAFMTHHCLTTWRKRYDEVITVFSNTGEENEQTLVFVDRCDKNFGFNTVWVEADVQHEEQVGTKHKVVTFDNASRRGQPFEEVIKKYGIPGPGWLHCTRELKLQPMRSYLNTVWEAGTYDTAIGIRADEPSRRSDGAQERNIVYPLMDWALVTKPHINEFWMKQPFRLELAGYQGNCKWCWKKSMRKHMTLMAENPRQFDFPERMEELYGNVKPGKERVFFRKHMSTKDLRATYKLNKDTLEKAEDDSIVLPSGDLFPLDLEPDGCIESCEINFEDAALSKSGAA